MTTPGGGLDIPATLLTRVRSTEPRIEWRPVATASPTRRAGRTLQVAHLFQEEARVSRSGKGSDLDLRVDAGPVGALVLLLELDRRGAPRSLVSLNPGRDPDFPGGAFAACWGSTELPRGDTVLETRELVELARYALP